MAVGKTQPWEGTERFPFSQRHDDESLPPMSAEAIGAGQFRKFLSERWSMLICGRKDKDFQLQRET